MIADLVILQGILLFKARFARMFDIIARLFMRMFLRTMVTVQFFRIPYMNQLHHFI